MGCLGYLLILAALALSLFGGVSGAAYLVIPGVILITIGENKNKKGRPTDVQHTAARPPRTAPVPQKRADDEPPPRRKTTWLSLGDIIEGASQVKNQMKDEYKTRQQEKIDAVLGKKRRR